jgi:hypothetical protein
MMGLGVEVEIGVSGLVVHFVSQRAIQSSVNTQVQEWEVVLTRDTAINSTMLPSSPRKPDIWTTLSERPLRLNSAPTISTERVAPVSVNLGSLLSAP